MMSSILQVLIALAATSLVLAENVTPENHNQPAALQQQGNLRRRTQDAQCFTGTASEVTDQCQGNNCCDGVNACIWSGVKTVCSGSCNGQGACLHSNFDRVEANSCIGLGACQNIDATTVGANSCQGQAACFNFLGQAIAEDSCNNFQACHDYEDASNPLHSGCNGFAECDGLGNPTFTGTGAEVTAACNGRCCVGDQACVWSWTKTVSAGACMGNFSCHKQGATFIGAGSCTGTAACRDVRVHTIEANSCKDYAACYQMNGQGIEQNTCNGWQSCRLTDSRSLPWLTGCNGASACEEQTL